MKIKSNLMMDCQRRFYMKRFYLLVTKKLCIFINCFFKDDEGPALHDHPCSFISVILWRGYYEVTESGRSRKRPGMILFRRATWKHRIELVGGKPAFTLMFRFWVQREWGFWHKKFIPFPQWNKTGIK
jgi:hypothetical protein